MEKRREQAVHKGRENGRRRRPGGRVLELSGALSIDAPSFSSVLFRPLSGSAAGILKKTRGWDSLVIFLADLDSLDSSEDLPSDVYVV